VGLGKVAEGMDIPQEKLMDSADAPKQWRAGNHQAVIDYCLNDCQMTNLIVCAIHKAQQVRWVTGKGYISSKPMPRLKSVEEVIKDTGPDQSWMDTPIPKSKFYKWLQEVEGTKT
ncbi:MAG: hypothetical protein L6437_06090, partial [Kiritimatiellae bacterium]|nr:hypothetical protein [Kiritimatiellia bacterium]